MFTLLLIVFFFFFFSSRRRHTRCLSDWSSDVCSSDLGDGIARRGERSSSQRAQFSRSCAADSRRVSHQHCQRSEERRVGKGIELGGGRIVKKKKKKGADDKTVQCQADIAVYR